MEDTLNNLEDLISALSNSSFLRVDTTTINVTAYTAREKLISDGSRWVDKLATCTNKLNELLQSARSAHVSATQSIESLAGWTQVSRKKKNARMSHITSTSPINLKPIVPITDALGLPAIRVLTFDGVKQDGELYYVESAGHFALRISGNLLHGNIGNIYTDEKTPDKIKDCKFAEKCIKRDNCDYYHDPVKFPGSKDSRNYIASSFLYTPPDVVNKNRMRGRRIGSRYHLDIDIATLQEDEIVRFRDQTMHDLLCTLLVSHTYK